MIPVKQHVEVRASAYRGAVTRIGLEVVIREFRESRSPEDFFDVYLSTGSLPRVSVAITHIL